MTNVFVYMYNYHTATTIKKKKRMEKMFLMGKGEKVLTYEYDYSSQDGWSESTYIC